MLFTRFFTRIRTRLFWAKVRRRRAQLRRTGRPFKMVCRSLPREEGRGRFVEMEVIVGPWAGRKAIVAVMSPRSAYYND